MQAIVLAGGFGTRLRTRVSDVPKPMAPIAGRPFLEFLLDGERIVRFGEKSGSGPGLIDAGICWLHRSALARYSFPETFSLESDHFQAHLSDLDLRGTATEAPFIDIGVSEDYDLSYLDSPRSTLVIDAESDIRAGRRAGPQPATRADAVVRHLDDVDAAQPQN